MGFELPYAEQELLKVRLTLQISKRIKAHGLQWAPFKPLVTRAARLSDTLVFDIPAAYDGQRVFGIVNVPVHAFGLGH